MKCPHCRVSIFARVTTIDLTEDDDGGWNINIIDCPHCNKATFVLNNGPAKHRGIENYFAGVSYAEPDSIIRIMVRPFASIRPQCPREAPPNIAEDYNEACLVFAFSAKASAALSRRCLQNILRTVGSATPSDLYTEIQEVLDKGNLPPKLAENLDYIRKIGNYAAHPNKCKATGEIVPIENKEAEWTLEILEELIEFYYVQPAISAQKRRAFDEKIGK